MLISLTQLFHYAFTYQIIMLYTPSKLFVDYTFFKKPTIPLATIPLQLNKLLIKAPLIQTHFQIRAGRVALFVYI